MDNLLISIIVPNYNHEKYLKQRLESIFNQTHQNFEVILLDDKSTDNSKDIISLYSKKDKVSHCIFNETNSGSTFKQWNKGVSLAKGDYIWIAESDDFCEVDFLEKVIKPFKKDKEIALTYCQSHKANSKGIITGNWIAHTETFKSNPFYQDFIMEGNAFIEHYLIHKNVIPNASAVLFKKESLQKIMPLIFKPFMKYNADWFYYVQLICNKKVAFISESLNYFRYHETSVIGKAFEETGITKIYKMELQMRAFMINFLKCSNLDNFFAIHKQYKTGNKKLHTYTTNALIEKGSYIKGISYSLRSRSLFKKTSLMILKKIKSKL